MLTTMLNETDLENRRLALTTLNSATHNKPDLVLPHLDTLLPLAMKETVPNPALIREVQMGPFKHKVDDGLELRKSAYETLYALLETSWGRLEVADVYARVVAGIDDDHDIRILCTLMLGKLLALASFDETKGWLEILADKFKGVLSVRLKDGAVKQEVERLGEASRAVVKVSLLVCKEVPQAAEVPAAMGGEVDAGVRAWAAYWEWVRKECAPLVKAVEEEMREKER